MPFFNKVSKGFTLVEVLVVVAIITVLITISLTSIDRYQNKSSDAVIGADLSQVRKIAVMVYIDGHSYEPIFDDADTLNDGLEAYPALKIIEDGIREIVDKDPKCFSEKTKYCVQSELLLDGYFCVDSTGFAGNIEGDYCEDRDGKRNCSQ